MRELRSASLEGVARVDQVEETTVVEYRNFRLDTWTRKKIRFIEMEKEVLFTSTLRPVRVYLGLPARVPVPSTIS